MDTIFNAKTAKELAIKVNTELHKDNKYVVELSGLIEKKVLLGGWFVVKEYGTPFPSSDDIHIIANYFSYLDYSIRYDPSLKCVTINWS